LGDILTKPLCKIKFQKLYNKIGLKICSVGCIKN
jgi:hypothetical protein